MKRLTDEYKRRLRCLSLYEAKRKAKIYQRKYLEVKRKEIQKRKERKSGILNYNKIIIKAPKVFSLDSQKNLRDLFKFITKLTQIVSDTKVCIDFSLTELMVADGTLYFLAYLDTINLSERNITFSIIYPKNLIVEQVLQQVGIMKLMRVKSRLHERNFNDTVRCWHFASGCQVNAESASSIFESFEGRITSELQKSIYKGVSEAMTNSFHHAYGETIPSVLRKWWMFSREYEGELNVVFCDLGVGIPNSLYHKTHNVDANWFDRLREYLKDKAPTDSIKIKAAIEIGQSRTKLPNRGKGLQQIVTTLDALRRGRTAYMTIRSGCGIYRRVSGQEFLLNVSKQDKIVGTMIHWSIPIET